MWSAALASEWGGGDEEETFDRRRATLQRALRSPPLSPHPQRTPTATLPTSVQPLSIASYPSTENYILFPRTLKLRPGYTL
eukprot:5745490-Pyramimonas_sp.AAC.2